MKQILMINMLIFACAFQCFAQDFLVYSTKGSITVKNGEKIEPVVSGMILKSTSIITITAEARLVILYETDKKLYIVKNSTTDQLGNIIKKDDNTTQQLTESYMSYIKQKITDNGKSKDNNYRQSAATSYRDPDSLLLELLIPNELNDTTNQHNNSNTK